MSWTMTDLVKLMMDNKLGQIDYDLDGQLIIYTGIHTPDSSCTEEEPFGKLEVMPEPEPIKLKSFILHHEGEADILRDSISTENYAVGRPADIQKLLMDNPTWIVHPCDCGCHKH